MIPVSNKKLYLIECLNQHYAIFKNGATVLDCATWLNCSKPTAQKHLGELWFIDLVRFENVGNKRLFYANRELTVGEYQTAYIPTRKQLKGF